MFLRLLVCLFCKVQLSHQDFVAYFRSWQSDCKNGLGPGKPGLVKTIPIDLPKVCVCFPDSLTIAKFETNNLNKNILL